MPVAFAVAALLYVLLAGDAASDVTRVVKAAALARKPARTPAEELAVHRRVVLLSPTMLVPVTALLALLAALRPGNQLLGADVWTVVAAAAAGDALVWAVIVLSGERLVCPLCSWLRRRP